MFSSLNPKAGAGNQCLSLNIDREGEFYYNWSFGSIQAFSRLKDIIYAGRQSISSSASSYVNITLKKLNRPMRLNVDLNVWLPHAQSN